MRLKQLINRINDSELGLGISPGAGDDFEVKGIACNSKQTLADFIFVAVKGASADGHDFIKEAIDKGAKAVILESPGHQATMSPGHSINFIKVKNARKVLAKLAVEFYGNPSQKIKVAGITGTNGKTTLSYLIEAILKEAGMSPAVIGTINYRFKDKVISSKNTTPGPLELQSIFSQMVLDGVNYAVMEVSSHALAQERTAGINFDCAIFTNLTQDHLDYHRTLEDYFQAKSRLFSGLDSGSFAIINNDDAYARRLSGLTAAKVISYGIEGDADFVAANIKFDALQTEFLLNSNKGKKDLIKSNLIGRHNVYNLLACISWAASEGIEFAVVKSALRKFGVVPGRLERVSYGGDFSVFVDYAHTEDALKNVITTLRPLTSKKIIVVFGCGGERDKTKRPGMGRIVSELADYAIITNDNPRFEDAQGIVKDIKSGIGKKNFCVIPERREAIKKALSLAGCQDIVLIAGKGHENYQILKDKVCDFDDRRVAKECLQEISR